MHVLIGVDPGARDTGVIAIFEDGRVQGSTLHNDGPLLPLCRPYLLEVGRLLDDLIDEAEGDYTLHVEGVTRPNWHVGKGQGGGAASNPEALLGTAQMLGAVMAWYDCHIIPPHHNGSHPLGTYPPELVGAGEQRKTGWELRVGTGKLRHQRSAWDIAQATPRDTLKESPTATRGPRGLTLDMRSVNLN